MDVLIEEFVVPKKTQFGTYMKSTCQDKVYGKNIHGKWQQIGLLGHASRCLTGLTGIADEDGIIAAAECSKQKGFPIRWAGAPADEPEVGQESEDEDEFEG